MRTSLAARGSVLLTTAALSLGLPSSPAAAVEEPASISRFTLGSNVVTTRAATQFFGTIATREPLPAGTSAVTRVSIDGRDRGSVRVFFGTRTAGVDIPRSWGSGRVVLGPTTFTYADATTSTDATRSRPFYARRDVRTTRPDDVALTVVRTDDAVRFRVRSVRIVQPATGRYVSLGRVRLQRLVGGAWRNGPTVRLDARGNGTVRLAASKKYRYRLFSARTDSQVEFRTGKTKRI